MKIFYLFFLTLVNSKLIKNNNLNSCKNCVYFKPGNPSLNKCEYFGRKDIIDDKIYYDYADKCREDEEKCGLEGKYFKKNDFAELKILKHKIINNSFLFLIPLTILISFFSNLIK